MVTVDKAQSKTVSDATRSALNDFFCSVQTKAFKQAVLAVKDRDEALDLIQDAMIRLAEKYADQKDNWPRLFQRILQNAIKDWYRRQKIKSLIFWRPVLEEGETLEGEEILSNDIALHASDLQSPERKVLAEHLNRKILACLQRLPHQQQQAFVLRAWWEHDVADTAFAMNCSSGSVKTHYSRACKKLQALLEDYQNEDS